MTMQKEKITPFLWFDTQAEEAVKSYLSFFKDGKITSTTHYGEGGPGAKGSVMTIAFELNGHTFVALNGGPDFKFTGVLPRNVRARETKFPSTANYTR